MDRRSPEHNESAPQILDGSHLSDDALEAYSLNRLTSENDIAAVEEHLLVCSHCEDRLQSTSQFISATKAAAQRVAADQKSKMPLSYAIIGIAAGLAGLLLLPNAIMQQTHPVSIEMIATRADLRIEGPADKPLELKLDMTGMAQAGRSWEIVASNNSQISSGSLNAADNKITIQPLAPGQYFVRLKAAGSQKIEREFSLLVR